MTFLWGRLLSGHSQYPVLYCFALPAKKKKKKKLNNTKWFFFTSADAKQSGCSPRNLSAGRQRKLVFFFLNPPILRFSTKCHCLRRLHVWLTGGVDRLTACRDAGRRVVTRWLLPQCQGWPWGATHLVRRSWGTISPRLTCHVCPRSTFYAPRLHFTLAIEHTDL